MSEKQIRMSAFERATVVMQDTSTNAAGVPTTNMRSRQLNLDTYNTDKTKFGYLDVYDQILIPWVDKEITLLEIGIDRGGSLELWRDYFPRGTIVGIDLKLPERFVPGERIQVFEGSQADERFLSKVANKTAPDGFDIIIDDASHIGELTRRTFWHLFDHHLKPGGLYAIEDWGTGYFDDFPDGKTPDLSHPPVSPNLVTIATPAENMKVPVPCHSYGMVGFVKELIDEQGAADITKKCPQESRRASKFESVHITRGIVFVSKVPPTTLTASPNPVPYGDGSGKTTISWNTGNTDIGKVYVSINGGEELLFQHKRQGSKVISWIETGSSYEFRLYDSAHTQLLAKITVTRATQ